MAKKTKKDLFSLIGRDLKVRVVKVSTQARSLILGAYREAKANKLGLLNLGVTLTCLYHVLKLSEQMQNISNSIIAAAVGGYVNTMVAFQAISYEIQRLLEIFGGDKV